MDESAFMRRAIDLAMRGCGRVIAEGFHEFFGGPHAEPNALAARDDCAGAAAHLSLEPCCIYGDKKLPVPTDNYHVIPPKYDALSVSFVTARWLTIREAITGQSVPANQAGERASLCTTV